jgi:hypothetical protein
VTLVVALDGFNSSALDSFNYSRDDPCGHPGGYNSMVGMTLAVALEGTEVSR